MSLFPLVPVALKLGGVIGLGLGAMVGLTALTAGGIDAYTKARGLDELPAAKLVLHGATDGYVNVEDVVNNANLRVLLSPENPDDLAAFQEVKGSWTLRRDGRAIRNWSGVGITEVAFSTHDLMLPEGATAGVGVSYSIQFDVSKRDDWVKSTRTRKRLILPLNVSQNVIVDPEKRTVKRYFPKLGDAVPSFAHDPAAPFLNGAGDVIVPHPYGSKFVHEKLQDYEALGAVPTGTGGGLIGGIDTGGKSSRRAVAGSRVGP